MFTIKSILRTTILSLSALCLLTSCGDDKDDEPAYTGGDEITVSDFTVQDLCGQWVAYKIVLADGSTKDLNYQFTVSNPQATQIQDNVVNYLFDTVSSDDDDSLPKMGASTIGGKVLGVIFSFDYRIPGYIVSAGGSAIEFGKTLDMLILNGSYLQLSIDDPGEPHPVDCQIYLSKF